MTFDKMQSARSIESVFRWARVNLVTPCAYTLMAFCVFLGAREFAKSGKFYTIPWDASWYYKVAVSGYQFAGDYSVQSTVAFAPGYPLFVRLIMFVFGSTDPFLMNVASLFLAITASVFLYAATKQLVGTKGARISLAFFLFNPFSLYLFNGYSEAASAAAMAAFFCAVVSGRYYWAAICVALLSLCRPQGVLLILVFLPLIVVKLVDLYRSGKISERDIFDSLIQLPIAASGFIIYIAWQYISYGDPLLFVHIRESAWVSVPNSIAVYDVPDKVLLSILAIFQDSSIPGSGLTAGVGHVYFWLAIIMVLPVIKIKKNHIGLVMTLVSLALPLLVFCLLVTSRVIFELGRYSIGFVACYAAPALYFLAAEEKKNRASFLLSFWSRHCGKLSLIYSLVGLIFLIYITYRYYHAFWI